ncbi:unnamed protein product [Caenorhabditis sp. 36 PRJEB53466]|nr:unnamed protein product [Caenorhabditis sp. 36 PRJEB53466]
MNKDNEMKGFLREFGSWQLHDDYNTDSCGPKRGKALKRLVYELPLTKSQREQEESAKNKANRKGIFYDDEKRKLTSEWVYSDGNVKSWKNSRNDSEKSTRRRTPQENSANQPQFVLPIISRRLEEIDEEIDDAIRRKMIDEVLFGEKFQESSVSSSHREIVRETENDRKEELVIKTHRCVSGREHSQKNQRELIFLKNENRETRRETEQCFKVFQKILDASKQLEKRILEQSKSPQIDNILYSVNDNRLTDTIK